MANTPFTLLPAWTHSAVGTRILSSELPEMERLVRRFHGETLLWAGVARSATEPLSRSMVRNRIHLLRPGIAPITEAMNCAASLGDLPFATHSLDGVVLHHALDAEPDARVALREVARILRPGGRLVVCAFNRWSPLGARMLAGGFVADVFGHWRAMSAPRVVDWLALLGFETESRVVYRDFALPFSWPAVEARTQRLEKWLTATLRHSDPRVAPAPRQLPVGNVFLLEARKIAMRPVRPERLAALGRQALAPVTYPKLSSWQRVDRPD